MLDLLPIEITAALIAVVPGAATVYLARRLNHLQETLARREEQAAAANYKLALFHMRVEVYKAAQDYLADFAAEGRPSLEAAVRLRHHARNARFLFPPAVHGFVEDLARKAFDYQAARRRREPLREDAPASNGLTEAERAFAKAERARMQAIEDWLTDVWESGRYLREFEPFLTLPDALFQEPAAAREIGGKSRDRATHARVNESASL